LINNPITQNLQSRVVLSYARSRKKDKQSSSREH
jgi:hypothetical protein